MMLQASQRTTGCLSKGHTCGVLERQWQQRAPVVSGRRGRPLLGRLGPAPAVDLLHAHLGRRQRLPARQRVRARRIPRLASQKYTSLDMHA
jgi:hypothetical protein